MRTVVKQTDNRVYAIKSNLLTLLTKATKNQYEVPPVGRMHIPFNSEGDYPRLSLFCTAGWDIQYELRGEYELVYSCHNKMAHTSISKYFSMIVFLILLSFFMWRIVESGKKLMSHDTVDSVSKQHSELRLHPSLSVCTGYKNLTWKAMLNDIDGNLQKFKKDVLLSLEHKNGSSVR